MPLETRWPWAVRSLELQPSAAHCHGWAGYCGSAASGYHCRWSTQTGKTRVPTSNAVTWPNEPEVIQKTLDNKQTVQRLSSLEWFLQGPEAEWLQMPPAKLCPVSQQWSHHKELFVELITVMSLRGFVVGCFCVLLFFLKVKTAKNCKNEFLSR